MFPLHASSFAATLTVMALDSSTATMNKRNKSTSSSYRNKWFKLHLMLFSLVVDQVHCGYTFQYFSFMLIITLTIPNDSEILF